MTLPSHLVFRCDASPAMGTGHVMRCLTLADVFRRDFDGRATFCCRELTGSLETRIKKDGHSLVQLKDDLPAPLVDIVAGLGARAVILDGYEFDPTYRQALGASQLKVVTFRDAGSEVTGADLIIDTSPIATTPSDTDATFLCGPDFALISPEILVERERPSSPEGILIIFGGADPHRLSFPVAKDINLLTPDTKLHVVLGGGVENAEAVQGQLSNIPNVSTSHDLPTLGHAIANAQLVVTAAGSSLYEVAALGRPMVLVITEDNQSALGNLDWAHIIDARGNTEPSNEIADAATELINNPAMMNTLAARASNVVDGMGARRILGALQTLGGF